MSDKDLGELIDNKLNMNKQDVTAAQRTMGCIRRNNVLASGKDMVRPKWLRMTLQPK